MPTEARASASTESPKTESRDGMRETLESIVVALILAFVFRAFVLEAYVIPTGSMAATLYGEHNTHTCTVCGYEYAYGRRRDFASQRVTPAPMKSICPNCGFHDETRPAENETPEAGDRILVLKWPFDVGGKILGPHRWEPTVFKDPSDGQTNFIKRLVGLPNEVLEIIDGDIYTAPADKLDKAVLNSLDRIRHINHVRLTGEGDDDPIRMIRDLASLQQAILPELDKCLTIQRKTPDVTRAQQSLWSVVFDQDYLPTRQMDVGWKPVGKEGSCGWDTSQRAVKFRGVERPLEAIRLVGRPAIDFYAYNVGERGGLEPSPVADRRLRCVLVPLQGDGAFRMRLTKYWDDFVAEIDFATGTATLTMTSRPNQGAARSTVIGSQKLTLTPNTPIRLELVNVDYRVSLVVDGKAVISTNDATYSPNTAWLRRRPVRRPGDAELQAWEPVAEIAAQRLDLDLRHLVVERDVYYTNASIAEEKSIRPPGKQNPFCVERTSNMPGSPGWATEGNPIWLRDQEYFMLGDNSPQSKDSRLWWEVAPHLTNRGEGYQVGTVPADQLCGRAFFVYWPNGLRPTESVDVGVIPNVGRMRWIR